MSPGFSFSFFLFFPSVVFPLSNAQPHAGVPVRFSLYVRGNISSPRVIKVKNYRHLPRGATEKWCQGIYCL